MVVIDWQMTGGGHLATEIVYMINQAQDFSTVDADMALLRGYHQQLTAALAIDIEYSFDLFYEHVCLVSTSTLCLPAISSKKRTDLPNILLQTSGSVCL